MAWPSRRFKTAAPGGAWTPDDMNGWQDQFIRPNGLVADDLSPQLAANLGINQTGVVRRAYGERLEEQTISDGRFVVGPTLDIHGTVVTAGLLLLYGEVEVRGGPMEVPLVVR